jgi:hypothetical protein
MLKTGNVSLERLDTRCSTYSGSDFSNLAVHCCENTADTGFTRRGRDKA